MSNANPYGRDVSIIVTADGTLDLDPGLLEVSGRQVLIQSILMRITTSIGSVIDSPNDCFDIRDELSDGLTPQQIASLGPRIQNQILRDQRVVGCTVTLNYDTAKSILTIDMLITDGQGPFPLTLAVSAVSVAIITASQ